MKRFWFVGILGVLCLSVFVVVSMRFQTHKPSTLEKRIGDVIAAHLEMYANQNAGARPANWAQFTNLVRYNAELLEERQMVIPELFALVPTNLTLTGFYKGELVVLQRSPSREYRNASRYFVFRDPSAEFSLGNMEEADVQALLGSSGVKLPDPNPQEVQAAKAAVEQLVAREQIEHQMIVAAAPKPTWADIGAVWWWRIKSSFFVYTENGHFTGRPRAFGIFVALGLFALVVYGWRWHGKRT
jgi:hypothetical protein